MKIVSKNIIKCNLCGDIVESEHRYDFKWCKCHTVANDGGTEYLKRCGDLENWTDISEYREATREEKIEYIKDNIDAYLGMLNDIDLDLIVEALEE